MVSLTQVSVVVLVVVGLASSLPVGKILRGPSEGQNLPPNVNPLLLQEAFTPLIEGVKLRLASGLITRVEALREYRKLASLLLLDAKSSNNKEALMRSLDMMLVPHTNDEVVDELVNAFPDLIAADEEEEDEEEMDPELQRDEGEEEEEEEAYEETDPELQRNEDEDEEEEAYEETEDDEEAYDENEEEEAYEETEDDDEVVYEDDEDDEETGEAYDDEEDEEEAMEDDEEGQVDEDDGVEAFETEEEAEEEEEAEVAEAMTDEEETDSTEVVETEEEQVEYQEQVKKMAEAMSEGKEVEMNYFQADKLIVDTYETDGPTDSPTEAEPEEDPTPMAPEEDSTMTPEPETEEEITEEP